MVDASSLEFIRQLSPENAWQLRWVFNSDMNHDGQITISDVGLWASWAFFAPGDAVLLGIMLKLPGMATFFEMTPVMLYGWWSFVISLLCWLIAFSSYSTGSKTG
jgi:hypothetical protein